MRFHDRRHAARELTGLLSSYRGEEPLVVGIPRGGVVVASEVAKALGGDFDVVLVHKLRHPRAPEVAVGAVDETGTVYLNDPAPGWGDLPEAYLREEAARQRADLESRRRAYSPVHPPMDPAGRTVIVIDDGLATGATMRAALQVLRARGASRLVAAAPIAPPETLATLQGLADEVICLEAPAFFEAVSQGYEAFPQVEDEEVMRCLADRPPPVPSPAPPTLPSPEPPTSPPTLPPDAVIFDFDGVIADTEPLHYQSFQHVLKPEGMTYTWDEYLANYVGFDDRDAFRFGFRSAGKDLDDARLNELIEAKERVFAELVRQGALAPYPGVRDLLSRLEQAGIPTALCTGARASDIREALAALDLEGAFAAVVTADEVAASKPDPESYLRSLRALALASPARALVPERCVAIEDTPAGIASARGAGLKVLAVTNTYPQEALAEAQSVADTLGGDAFERILSLPSS